MTAVVPVQPLKNQSFTITLADQFTRLHIYHRERAGLLVDVAVMDELVIGGVLARDRNRIVRDRWLGYRGDFAFVDQQGRSDPAWAELGSRYLLLYYPEEEIP